MELSELISRAKSLPADKQRRIAAILGALVADAAAQPLHWVYNEAAMAKAIKGREDCPEFLPKSANPYYYLPTGQHSPYGDELIVMLESLVACKGFDTKDNAKRIFKAFGPGSPYDNPLPSKYSKTMSDSEKSDYPIQGKWQGFLLRRFSRLYSEGKTVEDLAEEDKNVDPDNIPRCVALVALYAGEPKMLDVAYEASNQFHTSDLMLAVDLAAFRIMEQYILGSSDGKSDASVCPEVERVIEDLKRPDRLSPDPLDRAIAGHLQDVFGARTLSVYEATKKFGKA